MKTIAKLNKQDREPKFNREVLLDEAMQLVEMDDCSGICHSCANIQGGYEPDASNRKCEACGRMTVYGAEQTIIMIGL